MDYATTTTFVRIKNAKVDLISGEQKIYPYQHVQQSVQLPPIWLGEPIELIFPHQALNPL